MTELTEHQTKAIRDVIIAAQVQPTSVSPQEHNPDDVATPVVDSEIPQFGFKDFELDLSCLSPPPSPEPSVSEIRHSTPSPPPSSSPSARSVSFVSHTPSPTIGRSPKTRSMSRLSPVPASSIHRGSWQLMKYVGRGTPIDKNRRIEWAGISGDDVGEDGLLFSNVRSTSLDSAVGPSQRSVSPEWHVLPPTRRPSTLPTRSRSRTFATESAVEKPEIKLEGIGSDNSEWSSFMQTLLSSTESTSESSASASTSASTSNLPPTPVIQDIPPEVPPQPPTEHLMSPEEVQQLDTGLEMDLDINKALDLGLGMRGGTNWFDLGLLPITGRESPSSVYSSALQTPQASRPPSITASDHQSMTSTKAEPIVVVEFKSASRPWWRKMLSRLRRVSFFGLR